MAEVLLYGDIYSGSAAEFIREVNMIDDNELTVRVNSGGGVPEYGWGMAAKFKEFSGNKLVKVDGQAHSMALMFVAYADDVEAVDTSEFLLHRAAYSKWIEDSPDFFTEEVKGNLKRVNESLKKALQSKINIDVFNELKRVKDAGITFNDIWSMDGRVEVFLTAKEAKSIGLINKIVPLTSAKKAEIDLYFQKAARHIAKESKQEQPIKIDKKMTIEKLKSENPELYKQVFDAGMTAERERVEAFLVFSDIDAKAVKEGIEGGKNITPKQMSEFTLKAISKNQLKKIEEDNAPEIETEEPPSETKTEKGKKLAAFEEKVRADLGLKK